jgi:Uma2 family endonuclease
MSIQPKPRFCFEDYLAAERDALDVKHEYLAGEVFAMVGASFAHNLITANLIRILGNQLRRGPCVALANDMRTRVEAADACFYPDVLVLCDPPRFHDERKDVVSNPRLVIEVLSKSTAGYDRGDKFACYRALQSLQQLVLVAQDRIGIERYTRQPENQWLLSTFERPEDAVTLESIGCVLTAAEVYEGVDLDR